MNTIQLKLRDNRANYAPGETLEGRVEWALSQPPSALEIQLIWTTHGRGTTDRSVAASHSIGASDPNSSFGGGAPAMGNAPFNIELPTAPYSFAGTTIELQWSVAVIAMPAKVEATLPFSLSPGASGPILLTRVDKPDDLAASWRNRLGARR